MSDGIIKIDDSNIEEKTRAIDRVSKFETAALEVIDEKSTITANEKGRMAYEKSRSEIAAYGQSLSADAENIRKLNLTFKQFDEMMRALAESV